MNNRILSLSVLFIGLVLVQGLVFDRLVVAQQLIPYVSLLFIILYPTNANQTVFIIVAFLYGLSLDAFQLSGGVQAAACLTAAFLRPMVLRTVFGISADYSSIKFSAVAFAQMAVYILLIVLVHHLVLFGFIAFSWTRWVWVIQQALLNGLLTSLVALLLVFLFVSKK